MSNTFVKTFIPYFFDMKKNTRNIDHTWLLYPGGECVYLSNETKFENCTDYDM